MQKIVRIIPAPAEYGEPHRCNGTKVLLSDGQELSGITAMTIRAEAGDVWRAQVEVLAHPDEISDVVAEIQEAGKGDDLSIEERLSRIEGKLDDILSNMAHRPYYGGGPG